MKLTTKEITLSAMVLSIMVLSKLITGFIPDLPGNMGSPIYLLEWVIISSTLLFGVKITTIAFTIHILILSLIFPTFFINGITWVDGFDNVTGVYFFDYFLPLGVLIFMGLHTKLNSKRDKIILFAFVLLLDYIFHTTAGYIFFSSWAWDGWGPMSYSIVYNLIRSSIFVSGSCVLIFTLVKYGDKITKRGTLNENW